MSHGFECLNFVRRMNITAVYERYESTRSSRPDCGILHWDLVSRRGGETQWIIWDTLPLELNVPAIPIERFDDDQKISVTYPEKLAAAEKHIDYPGILITSSQIPVSGDQKFLQDQAKTRSLTGGTQIYLAATVLYNADENVNSDAFSVEFYYADQKYLRLPGQWVSLSPGSRAVLQFDSVSPKETAVPMNDGTILWHVPASGFLLARITDIKGERNPIPTPEEGEMLPMKWFQEQKQWAVISITPAGK